jgi:hypothetical protein
VVRKTQLETPIRKDDKSSREIRVFCAQVMEIKARLSYEFIIRKEAGLAEKSTRHLGLAHLTCDSIHAARAG